MTILHSLVAQYDRMAAAGEVPPPGYSLEKIGWCMVIEADGTPVELTMLGGVNDKGKHQPQIMPVPAPVKRTVGIAPNFLWDKTAYTLGVVKGEETDDGKKRIFPTQGKRTADEHAAFVDFHRQALAGMEGAGLEAVLQFFDKWTPNLFDGLQLPLDALDQNIVFRLKDDPPAHYMHLRDAARAAWTKTGASDADMAQCLITGVRAPIARLHPSVKGVVGAQSSGASLVAFNQDSFVSYDKTQGDNAPVSEAAAFSYGAALNAMLARGSERSTRIGDATVVFWAEANDAEVARQVEAGMSFAFNPDDQADDIREKQAGKLRSILLRAAAGRGTETGDPDLLPGTTVHILGLSPNAARLAVRFWHSGTFGDFAAKFVQHWQDLRLEPPAFKGDPAAWALLYEIAPQRKADNIPPLLGGALMRAFLTGGAYPKPMLAAAIMRLRAGDAINGPRTAIIKACLARDARLYPSERKKEVPVALDREEDNSGYLLGRLFAVLETAQRLALGKVNATIRDRFFASASATPAGTFPTLLRNANPHLAKLRKGAQQGAGIWLEREIAEIFDKMGSEMPSSLRIEDQGRFVIGYYHQRFTKRADKDETVEAVDEAPHAADEEGDGE